MFQPRKTTTELNEDVNFLPMETATELSQDISATEMATELNHERFSHRGLHQLIESRKLMKASAAKTS